MRYNISVPLYAEPLENLIQFQNSGRVNIRIYGGSPDSPLNGGRNNFTLDGVKVVGNGRNFESLNKLSDAAIRNMIKRFYETVEAANRNGISFYLTYTNMFFSKEEWNAENIEPIENLIKFSKKYSVRNGIICNNPALEEECRHCFSDALEYVSSCTKYYSRERILSPEEVVGHYLKDMKCYDLVVITPQDSRNEEIIRRLADRDRSKFSVIVNSYCSSACNSYWHLYFISKENKIKLKDLTSSKFSKLWSEFSRYSGSCPVPDLLGKDLNVLERVAFQLSAGAINFKIGRGLWQDCLDGVIETLGEK